MAKKVQKKIKYYKTPLEPVYDPETNLYGIKFQSKKGKTPKELDGIFTDRTKAQRAIDNFLSKHQVEYID